MQFITAKGSLAVQDGELYHTRYQELPQEFWDELNERKKNFKIDLDGFTDAAMVPAAVIDKWMAEGFNAYTAPLNEILQKLRVDGMDAFILCEDTTFGRGPIEN